MPFIPPPKRQRQAGGSLSVRQRDMIAQGRGKGQTLMTLGTFSLGVCRPKQASIPQKSRMEKTMEKSATRVRTCREDNRK